MKSFLSAAFLTLLLLSCATSVPERPDGQPASYAGENRTEAVIPDADTSPAAEVDPALVAPPLVAIPPAAPEGETGETEIISVPVEGAEHKPVSLTASRGPAVDPDDALIISLAGYPRLPAGRNLPIRIFPQDAEVLVLSEDSLKTLKPVGRDKDTLVFNTDVSALLLRAEGYESRLLPAGIDGKTGAVKLEKSDLPVFSAGEIGTGYQPKSVRFSPDGKSVFVAHLGDTTALSQFSVNPLKKIRDLNVPQEYRSASGFVETVILPERDEIWVSQMTRNIIHVFGISGGNYITSIPVSGGWPKVLLASADEKKVWVSCWDSDRVVEIDTSSRKETRFFATSGTPRGLASAPDGNGLLVAIYSSSGVDYIDLKSGTRKSTWDAAPGRIHAMRHIVHDRPRGEYYITAMGTTRVYRLSEKGEWLGWWNVGEKPNSCELSPDGRFLFVSCRGPNNPDDGYLFRGYEFGRVYIINLATGQPEGWIWGRDQTTGLDVSPDGRHLAFTDFLSRNLEMYRIR